MKSQAKLIKLLGLLISAGFSSLLHAQGTPPSVPGSSPAQQEITREPRPAKPRPTSEEVTKKISGGTQLKYEEIKPEKKDQSSDSRHINSVFLVDNSVSTKIPANSIIFVPDRLKGKVSEQIKGKLVPWKRFYSRNMSSIHLFPVTIEQARGTGKIKQEHIQQFEKLGKIVIATHDGGLITVNPEALKPEEKK